MVLQRKSEKAQSIRENIPRFQPVSVKKKKTQLENEKLIEKLHFKSRQA